MKPYLICPTCGSDDVMKNGMTRRENKITNVANVVGSLWKILSGHAKTPTLWQKLSYFCWSGFPSLVLRESWAFLRAGSKIT